MGIWTRSRPWYAATSPRCTASRGACSAQKPTPKTPPSRPSCARGGAYPASATTAPFPPWLYRIVTRRCLDLIAARRPTEALNDTQPDPRLDPVNTAEQRARLQAVTRAIAHLPGDQRAALILREFEGLSYDQVADALNTTVPAIKGRIHRARLAVIQHTTGWR